MDQTQPRVSCNPGETDMRLVGITIPAGSGPLATP